MLGSNCAERSPHPWRRLGGSGPALTDRPTLTDQHRHLRSIIESAVAPAFAVPRTALWAGTRGAPSEAFARQVAMYLAHVGFGLKLTEVARLFVRDRSTVAHACALVEDRRDAAPFDRALDLLEGALRLVSQRLS
jgi:chromosomal replication initiation ATPase DnaA